MGGGDRRLPEAHGQLAWHTQHCGDCLNTMEGVLRASHAGHSKHTLALSCTHTPNISSTHAFPQGYQLRHCYNKQKGIYNDAIQGIL